MAADKVGHKLLSEMPAFEENSEELRVIIETPKGSRNKYSYDPEYDCFKLRMVLPEGMTFPYDFGFIPSTLGEDGDPLDVLVLMDASVMPGCLIQTRLIGAIEAKQREGEGSEWKRNDRLIAVATHARSHAEVKSFADLRPHLVEEIRAFFAQYNRLRGHQFEPIADSSPQTAYKLVKQGMK